MNITNIEHKIRLHRGLILNELITAFKDIGPFHHIVTLELFLPNGMPEAAEDNGGVTRDVISKFWGSFYDECTLGNSFKMPCLRHDFGKAEWQSVAKIIIFGYTRAGYFPIRMSRVFMEQCLYGQIISDLTKAFLTFIPESDAQILNDGLKDISSIQMEELLDVLDQHEVKVLPNENNLGKIVNEVVHKELVHAPV